ncbi:glycogen synthase GlgA [Rhodocaloribacter litoris]|uniref:glycogen synthase GlgA n=1 Tax=Rhodocaloribacter litoris TaxID=2558931 RepID=UPI00142212CB|nr:glycogen synthase GlgA [Rhodocaloribacter litoris]QXD16349.1 glycogen synthase GlgA [Rhodocaloribacter litoris]
MKVCFATSECVPYAKTGGLADVSGSLPKALAELGCEVKLFMPLYASIPTLDHDLVFATELQDIPVTVGDHTHTFNVWYGHLPDSPVEVYFIDCPHYYHRPGVYTSDPDEDERYIFLQHAVFKILQRYAWAPDLIHCNDWQTSLMPVYLHKVYHWDRLFHQTATLLTIHNISYQGRFPSASIYKAGLQYDLFYPGGPYELHGAFCFMKAGIVFAGSISTVSETYAHEIQTPAFGADLDGILRARGGDLYGILNGIDTDLWHPARDPYIPQNYDFASLRKKQKNKRALLERFGLEYDEKVPTFGIVSRLTGQKGFDLLQPILGDLLVHHKMQLVVLGSGERRFEDFFNWAAATFPDRVGVYIGYHEELAHWIEAGADLFLMPSHFEPCGLNQMYSLLYGTVPIVHRTGGLADTVHDFHEFGGQGNGFSFYDATPDALYATILRAMALFHEPETWREIQRRGMMSDFSWKRSAEKYLDLYWHTVHKRRGH